VNFGVYRDSVAWPYKWRKVRSGYSAKFEVGERYIHVWALIRGRVPFPSIVTSGGGEWRSLSSHYTLITEGAYAPPVKKIHNIFGVISQ